MRTPTIIMSTRPSSGRTTPTVFIALEVGVGLITLQNYIDCSFSDYDYDDDGYWILGWRPSRC